MRILRWSKTVKHQILKAIVFAIIILAGCMLTVSRELEPIICGISETKDVPYQALLVLPSETIEAAGKDISDIASKTKPFSEWLSENGWNEIL